MEGEYSPVRPYLHEDHGRTGPGGLFAGSAGNSVDVPTSQSLLNASRTGQKFSCSTAWLR